MALAKKPKKNGSISDFVNAGGTAPKKTEAKKAPTKIEVRMEADFKAELKAFAASNQVKLLDLAEEVFKKGCETYRKENPSFPKY